MEADDGYIYITYDRDRGCFKNSLEEAYACAREVLTAKITEEDILNGKLVSKDGFLKNVVSKLDRLAAEDPDPYQESAADVEAFADSLLAENGDILEKVFAHYSIACIDIAQLDMEKLDKKIDLFRKNDSKDRKLLLKIIDLLRATPKVQPDPYPVIAHIKKYIEDHLPEDITVAEIAKDMNISVYYLSHLFKSVTGITLIEFRNELRLTKAKQLLIRTNEPINKIAGECGFSNASYFTEVFARSEKIPPSEFRKYHTTY
jgi:AraC-like DNA-binding protein